MCTEHAQASLVNDVIASDLTVKHLWLRYLALGGARTRQELQGYLSGESKWSAGETAILAHALDEYHRLSD